MCLYIYIHIYIYIYIYIYIWNSMGNCSHPVEIHEFGLEPTPPQSPQSGRAGGGRRAQSPAPLSGSSFQVRAKGPKSWCPSCSRRWGHITFI